MFNLETISLFSKKRDSTHRDTQAIEKAQEELKRYECFNTLLNGKEECFRKCKDIILQDVLNATRSNTRINRDYLLGYQDAIDIFLTDLARNKDAIDKIK